MADNFIPVLVDTNKGYYNPDGTYDVWLRTRGHEYRWLNHTIELSNGMRLYCYSDDGDERGNRDDLIFEGVASFAERSGRWQVRTNLVQHVSDTLDDSTHWARHVDWPALHALEAECLKKMEQRPNGTS
jgi:hypothetical protein